MAQPVPEFKRGKYVVFALYTSSIPLTVWKAYKEGDKRRTPVVLKESHLADRVSREARILRHLKGFCRGVPAVLDTFSLDRRFYVVLEYVGEDLGNEGFTIEDSNIACKWCAQLLQHLSYIHAGGFIHGDIKPANITIKPANATNKKDRLYFIDLETAWVVDETNCEAVAAKFMISTPLYSSPNIDRGYRPSKRDDLYSLVVSMIVLIAPEGEAALPWYHFASSACTAEDFARLARMKERALPSELRARLPAVILGLLSYVTRMGYNAVPDYTSWICNLRKYPCYREMVDVPEDPLLFSYESD